MDRKRLGGLWQVGVAITVLSFGLSAVGWLGPQLVDWPLLGELGPLGVLVVVAVVAVVWSRPRPFSTLTPPRRRDERERGEATKQLLRGKPFTSPGPDPGDIERSRRGLWAITMQTCWWPLMAASWALQAHTDTVPLAAVVLFAIGSTFLLGGSVGALISVRARTRRLDLFEDTGLLSENAVH